MSQERLDALFCLFVERELLIGIDFNDVIDEFKHLLLVTADLYCKFYVFIYI